MPRQMFDHVLDALKGWFDLSALDYTSKISANVSFRPVYAGRCVHLNDDGEFEMGCTGNQVPLFLFQNSDDPDVSNEDLGPTLDKIEGGAIGGIRKHINAWVGLGAYEITTTEFDSDQTYLPNDPLRAVADNDNSTTGGRITNQGVVTVASLLATGSTGNVTALVGHVSAGASMSIHKRQHLAFWPGHYPGHVGS